MPTGWISDLPLPRTAQLRALGNGVVPQQAAYALNLLLADLHQLAQEALTPRWLAPCARWVASPSDQTSTAAGTRRAA